MDILTGREAYHMTLNSPRWSLVTKLAIFAISASKHGEQLLNEVFIYSKDITPSPGYLKGWRIFRMAAVALRPKSFQELVFKALKNRKHSGCVDRQQVRSFLGDDNCK